MYDNRTLKNELRTIELPNGVKMVKTHIDFDMSSYDTWIIHFPDNSKEIEMEISDVMAEKFAKYMNGQ